MKKLMALVGIILAAAIVAPAVSHASTGISKGVKLGLNIANFSGADSEPAENETKEARIGFAAGIFLGVGLGPLNIQPEALYSMKGVTYEWGDNSDTIKLAYLDIPVLLKYDVVPGPTPISLFAGPSLGILLSAEVESKRGSATETTDIADNVNSADLGLVIGVGVGLPMGLSADARYQMGLTKIGKEVDGVEAAKTYNSVISIMVGKAF